MKGEYRKVTYLYIMISLVSRSPGNRLTCIANHPMTNLTGVLLYLSPNKSATVPVSAPVELGLVLKDRNDSRIGTELTSHKCFHSHFRLCHAPEVKLRS